MTFLLFNSTVNFSDLIFLLLGVAAVGYNLDCGLHASEKLFQLLGLCRSDDEQENNDDRINVRQQFRCRTAGLRVRTARKVRNRSQNVRSSSNGDWNNISAKMTKNGEKYWLDDDSKLRLSTQSRRYTFHISAMEFYVSRTSTYVSNPARGFLPSFREQNTSNSSAIFSKTFLRASSIDCRLPNVAMESNSFMAFIKSWR